MASEFRPSTPSDAAELTTLAQRLLGVLPGNPMFTERHLQWKYWSPWPQWQGARSYVLTRERRIVAHTGVLPLICQHGERRLTLLHPFDWMSEPSAVGSGAALLQRLAAHADGLLIVGGSELTQRMARPLGFRALGSVTRYAAAVPGPGAVLPATAADAARLARCTVSRTSLAEDCQSEHSQAESVWLSFERSPGRLQEYLQCPALEMTAHTARCADMPLGGFLLAFAPAQARIVALWGVPPRSDDHALLVRLAHRQAASHPGVEEVVCMANAPTDQQALAAAGFAALGDVPMFLLASPLTIGTDQRVAFQMIDGDVAFLHHGEPQRWL
jgi:hypothetical protein